MISGLVILAIQAVLGALDTILFHEYQLRLPTRKSARRELMLHASRDFIYAIIFGFFAWFEPHGAVVLVFVFLFGAEIMITLADFVEEDRTRKLPAVERVMHAVMGILYGAFLSVAYRPLLEFYEGPTAVHAVHYGVLSWVLTVFSIGVAASGVRDYFSARNGQEWPKFWERA